MAYDTANPAKSVDSDLDNHFEQVSGSLRGFIWDGRKSQQTTTSLPTDDQKKRERQDVDRKHTQGSKRTNVQ